MVSVGSSPGGVFGHVLEHDFIPGGFPVFDGLWGFRGCYLFLTFLAHFLNGIDTAPLCLHYGGFLAFPAWLEGVWFLYRPFA